MKTSSLRTSEFTLPGGKPTTGTFGAKSLVRQPGFGGRQTRKPGFEKYPPGLHSLVAALLLADKNSSPMRNTQLYKLIA